MLGKSVRFALVLFRPTHGVVLLVTEQQSNLKQEPIFIMCFFSFRSSFSQQQERENIFIMDMERTPY